MSLLLGFNVVTVHFGTAILISRNENDPISNSSIILFLFFPSIKPKKLVQNKSGLFIVYNCIQLLLLQLIWVFYL